MIIDVYADIACPWCYVGRARLKQALGRRPGLAPTLRWRPFQLQPDMPKEGRDFREVLSRKFGGWDQAQRMFDRLRKIGAEEGLSFDFDAIEVAPNTADAHRLVLWASDQEPSRSDALSTALFRAYFSAGRDVSNPEVLADCAAEVGLSREAARALLAGSEYAPEVRESQQEAWRRGVTGVPCYVFGSERSGSERSNGEPSSERSSGERVLTGAQPAEVFARALDALAPEATE